MAHLMKKLAYSLSLAAIAGLVSVTYFTSGGVSEGTLTHRDIAEIYGGDVTTVQNRDCQIVWACSPSAAGSCDAYTDQGYQACNAGSINLSIPLAGDQDCGRPATTDCDETTPNNDCAKQYACEWSIPLAKCVQSDLIDTHRAPADCSGAFDQPPQ